MKSQEFLAPDADPLYIRASDAKLQLASSITNWLTNVFSGQSVCQQSTVEPNGSGA